MIIKALGEKAFNETKETTTAASGNIESSINTSSSTSSTTTTPATTFDQEMLDELYQDSQNRCNCRKYILYPILMRYEFFFTYFD